MFQENLPTRHAGLGQKVFNWASLVIFCPDNILPQIFGMRGEKPKQEEKMGEKKIGDRKNN